MYCNHCSCAIDQTEGAFKVGEEENLCFDCAVQAAREAMQFKAEQLAIKPMEDPDDDSMWYVICTLCNEPVPVDTIKREADLGFICEGCVNELKSRGEEIYIQE